MHLFSMLTLLALTVQHFPDYNSSQNTFEYVFISLA